jgi:hypothetical protein
MKTQSKGTETLIQEKAAEINKNFYRENTVETLRKFITRKLNQETSFTENDTETLKNYFL